MKISMALLIVMMITSIMSVLRKFKDSASLIMRINNLTSKFKMLRRTSFSTGLDGKTETLIMMIIIPNLISKGTINQVAALVS